MRICSVDDDADDGSDDSVDGDVRLPLVILL